MVKINYILFFVILFLASPYKNYAQCRDTIILNKRKYIPAQVIGIRGKELRYIIYDKNGNQQIEKIDTSRIYEIKYCVEKTVTIYNQDKVLFVEDPDVKFYKPIKQPTIKAKGNSYHFISFNPFNFLYPNLSVAYERQIQERFAFRLIFEKGFHTPTGQESDPSINSYARSKTYGTGISFSYLPKTLKKIKSLIGLTFDYGQFAYYDLYGNREWDTYINKHLAIHIAGMVHFGYIFPIKCFFISPRVYAGIQKNFTIHDQQNYLSGCFKFEMNMGVRF